MHKRAKLHKKRNFYLRKKAFDYSFLAEYFGIELKDEDDDAKELREFFQSVLEKHLNECHYMDRHCKCGLRTVAKDLRMYLKNLSKWNHTYWQPVWNGLSKVEDN